MDDAGDGHRGPHVHRGSSAMSYLHLMISKTYNGPKMGLFALLLPKLIIFNTCLLEDALEKMNLPIQKCIFQNVIKKTGQSFLMSSWIECIECSLNHKDLCAAQNLNAFFFFCASLTCL